MALFLLVLIVSVGEAYTIKTDKHKHTLLIHGHSYSYQLDRR